MKFVMNALAFLVVYTPLVALADDAVESTRESSKRIEKIDGKNSYYVKPPVVGAGSFPTFVGDVYDHLSKQYPGLATLTTVDDVNAALDLMNVTGLNEFIGTFLPAGWDPIKGAPLAFVAEDLRRAGYSGGIKDAEQGLLDIFRIKLETPTHDTEFPDRAVLHVVFEQGKKRQSIETMMTQLEHGVFRIEDVYKAIDDLKAIKEIFKVGQRNLNLMFGGEPTKMRLAKFTGFILDETTIEDLPRFRGTILLHHIHIGSYRVVSGWQWAGRPHGLPGSQQLGFVQ